MAGIPVAYQAFFLYIEPVATLVGAFYAWFMPSTYLQLIDASSAPGVFGLPLATNVVARQLGNMYLAFAFNEAVVLRSTNDLRVWKALLLGLLIADFGHLFSCYPLGLRLYYDVLNWNAIDFGNIGFVYIGALTRICFLSGLGFKGTGLRQLTSAKPKSAASKKQKSKAQPVIEPPETPSPVAADFDDSPAKAVRKTPRSTRRSRPKTPA